LEFGVWDLFGVWNLGFGALPGHAEIQMKAPRTKLQKPEKLQIPSPKGARLSQVLELRAWDFSGAWCLGFGASIVNPKSQI
jgi:hypothetical protein